ncbi:MAG: hypothetical protein KGJ13_08700 [Patescibacteria group bacterium]|nr:hypothetical protein [Patescibacteria group bacterium]
MTSTFGIPGGGTITPFASSSARSAAYDLGLTNNDVMDIEGEEEKRRRLRDIAGSDSRIDPYTANPGRYGPATLSLFNRP